MSKFQIQGPNRLSGEISVLGAKNVALKLIAATVLIKAKVTLTNMPEILDVQNMLEILEKNNASIQKNSHTITIDTTNLTDTDPDPILMEKLRASVVYIGPYLARFGQVNIPRPGGCSIGSRSIEVHLDGFRQMGVEIVHRKDINDEKSIDHLYHLSCHDLYGQNINLTKASCTATENIMMASVLVPGKTVISNAAREPQINDLASFLNSAGASIAGAGTSEIEIIGTEALHGLEYEIMPDPIEAGTFVCLALATGSEIKVTNCKPDHLRPFLDKISEIGAEFEVGEDYILVKPSVNLQPTSFETKVFPGFPTDLQAPMGLVLTQANGESQIKESLFENRLGYLTELEKMGAKIKIKNDHEAFIYGPTKLHGAQIASLDLRAGATVLLAGLAATGVTIIDNAEMIDRGYEKIEQRLAKLGANIKRIA